MMKKPSRPVATTMCRMRGISGGAACRMVRCRSIVANGSAAAAARMEAVAGTTEVASGSAVALLREGGDQRIG